MTGNPFNWSPCMGCTCPNHYPPSHDFPSVRRTLDVPNLARLTRSNDEPIEGEVHTLRAMIASYKAEILDINTAEPRLAQFIFHVKNRISLARRELDALRQERKHIHEAIIERRRLLHPTRRLPTEILLRIFRSTIEFPISRSITMWNDHWDFHPTENTPWSIERVCKLWRTVALSFPELWSSINIIINDDSFGDDSYDNTYIRRLVIQLHRSKNYPLELSVWNDDGYSHFTKFPPALTAILYSFSTRVECLHLYLTSEMFCALPSLHLSFPSLKSLCLFPTDAEAIDGYINLDLFPCPLLRRLHVVEVSRVSNSFRLPWTQITHFSSEPIRLLDPNPFEEEWTQEYREMDPLGFSSLRIFTISKWSYQDYIPLVQVLDRLTLPTLKKLQVSCGREDLLDSDDTFIAIHDLLNRSGPPPISVLHFDHAEVLAGEFLNVLRTCPTLEDIRLTSVNKGAIRGETLLQLTLKVDGTAPLVPRLHILHISDRMSFDMQTFVDMVESRWTLAHVQSPPLRRLSEVNLCRFIDAENSDEPDEDEVERITVLRLLMSTGRKEWM
ncbi:hypothetical protein EV421DRAFT_1900208 [Armillaria borealis]|uniref:F-box domain-containing protein n=1 Tax=Armillaria borealis TaxID=47425 RepID=A0AA39JT77_9AGAR|nr:hypothetical protein EV421DRAFT_1900208 [Armillaria borealis]